MFIDLFMIFWGVFGFCEGVPGESGLSGGCSGVSQGVLRVFRVCSRLFRECFEVFRGVPAFTDIGDICIELDEQIGKYSIDFKGAITWNNLP